MSNLALQLPASSILSASTDVMGAPIEASLWRGILIVEPNMAVLNSETLLLTNSNYCVTPAFSNGELFTLRNTKAVALAILSDHLGHSCLAAVATTVRRQWPRARILILGQAGRLLEDHLYDEQVGHSSDPKQLLLDLERLYKGLWNQRSNTLDWNTGRSALCFARPPVTESDPTKALTVPPKTQTLRDTPSHELIKIATAE